MELMRRENKLDLIQNNMKSKNWPTFIPFLFHNIDLEIPYIYQTVIRKAYTIWRLTVIGHLINWIIITLL